MSLINNIFAASTFITRMNTINSTTIKKQHFGTTTNGEPIEQYLLKNKHGIEVSIITYGGRITHLKTPDKAGNLDNIVLGFDNLDGYLNENPFFGALIGRYANRIANAKFSLNGSEYQLDANNGPNNLHGGKGYDTVIWNVEHSNNTNEPSITLSYYSKDNEEGFPGNLNITVVYTLTNDNMLLVEYTATTDKTTIVNLTQHSYFNLSGNLNTSILDHELSINADTFLPLDANQIPTGEFKKVAQTPFDFTQMKPIGKDIAMEHPQLKTGNGYDHCWVLNNANNEFKSVALAQHNTTGRTLEVFTTEPGMQLYSGNFLDGKPYNYRTGFCLETQHFPNSPNQPDFPSVVLHKGEEYRSKTGFRFSVI